jgi:hypothetical protein
VDELAQRIGVGQQSRLAEAPGIHLAVRFTKRDPAIAGETPVGGLERRHSADFPFAGH